MKDNNINLQNSLPNKGPVNNNINKSIPNNIQNNVVGNQSSVNGNNQTPNNVNNMNKQIPNSIQNNVTKTPQGVNVNNNAKTMVNHINSPIQNNSNVNMQSSNVAKNGIQNNVNGNNPVNTQINNTMMNNGTNTKQSNVNAANNKVMMQNNAKNNSKNIDFTKMPVVDVVNYIIITAVNAGASDIHYDPTDKGITVRLRIDGILNDYFFLPLEIKQNVITRMKIMAGMNITETRLPQDGGIRDRISGRDLDLRVSSLPTKRGEKIVIRILDYTMSLQGIESLCFNETNYNKILKMINNPYGIILVTGATGTGKSTTLYSFLQKLNVEGTNIITVEDPVEMDIAGINQVQVNSDIGLDFAAVLRSILRQDPNVIMIGEIRDSETAKIAVRASITGHLVLSTIHTNNSLNTIERLLDMEVERYLLASALTGIVSQQLARKLCDKCKVKREVTSIEKGLFDSVLGFEVKEVFEPSKNGCPHCSRGYKGRIALHEVLLISQDIRDAISIGMRKEQLRELVYNKDVITMLQDGLYKVIAGFTTIEEVLKLIEVEDEHFDKK